MIYYYLAFCLIYGLAATFKQQEIYGHVGWVAIVATFLINAICAPAFVIYSVWLKIKGK